MYRCFNDPGHGWLEVPERDVIAAEVAGEISAYSYFDPEAGTVYLEEDFDMPLFIRAAGVTLGDIRESSCDTESPIRSLPSYRAARPAPNTSNDENKLKGV